MNYFNILLILQLVLITLAFRQSTAQSYPFAGGMSGYGSSQSIEIFKCAFSVCKDREFNITFYTMTLSTNKVTLITASLTEQYEESFINISVPITLTPSHLSKNLTIVIEKDDNDSTLNWSGTWTQRVVNVTQEPHQHDGDDAQPSFTPTSEPIMSNSNHPVDQHDHYPTFPSSSSSSSPTQDSPSTQSIPADEFLPTSPFDEIPTQESSDDYDPVIDSSSSSSPWIEDNTIAHSGSSSSRGKKITSLWSLW